MYLHRIVLEHIRGFERLDFTLERPGGSYAGWTVFTGDNGSGKSSLLKAIALGLVGRDTARALQPSFNRWVRHGAPNAEGSILLEIVQVEGDDELVTKGRRPEARFPAKLSLKNNSKETSLQAVTPAKKTAAYQTPDRTIWSPDAPGWFACGYGPFRRMFGASSEATQMMVASSTARFATMFQEAASLAEADRWLRELRYEDYHTIIAARPDTILLTPAFGLQNTRSPEAVAARSEYARL